MSDGNGQDVSGDDHQRPVVIQGNPVGVRSASPAKRSAADMEGGGQHIPGSFTQDVNESTPSHFDQVMQDSMTDGATVSTIEIVDSQDSISQTTAPSDQASIATNTSTITLASQSPPSHSTVDVSNEAQRSSEAPSIDEQVRQVTQLTEKPLTEGDRGLVVSAKWISRVLARSSQNMNNSQFPKEARQGEIGPIDNSDIVPDGAFLEPILKDAFGHSFIPIKRNLTLDEDYRILPYDAWGLILGWYGCTLGQKQILRYVHNTAPAEAAYPNYQYELEPPVITVRKIPQPTESEEIVETSRSTAIGQLRLKDERRGRGQLSSNDAVQLVSSKSERFIDFLKRAKEAAGIPRSHKVKIWKLTQAASAVDLTPEGQANGIVPSTESPKGVHAPQTSLILDVQSWNKMEGGKDFELVDAKDETDNAKYNGKSAMSVYELYEDATIALEEMIGGPGGGEYPSDSKKHGAKLAPTKRILGSKPGSAAPSGRTSPAPPSGGILTRGRARRDGRTRGTVGLTNLGNTCYMNSALQCIRSVEELAIFFLSGKYKSQINASNPLGHKGAMAKRYAELLESMYADTATGAITPNAFRKTLGSIQPMFSGYGQQDSQEFLSFLVDALHEDLNRIQKKPYNENPDSDDKTVHDPEAIIKLGEVYRANHRARNDSVAMDLFSGFYKNTMECPKCDKISITFDPYSLLTVQLPIESTFQHDITFVPLRGTPVNHAIDIDKNASIKMLKEKIASHHPGVKYDRLFMAEVYSHKIYKVFDNSASLSEAGIQPNDFIFVFELDAVPSNPAPAVEKRSQYSMSYNKTDTVPDMDDPKADHFAVPVFSRQKHRNGNTWENIFHPVYIMVTRDEAQDYDTILKKILIAVSRLTSKPILTDLSGDAAADRASNVEMKDESAGEDNAQITERSVSSDEGYVEVSLEQSEGVSGSTDQSNGNLTPGLSDHSHSVPPHFMDAQYFLTPDLRNNLFVVNYGPSESGGLHCSGMQSIGQLKEMSDRVKAPARRTSTQSSSSDEDSTTSTPSGGQVDAVETEESDADDSDKPDLILGGATAPDADMSEDELPDNPLLPTSRKGRRKMNKHGKKGRNNMTYSKKGQRGHRQRDSQGKMHSVLPQGRFSGRSFEESEGNQYFVKLGEGIVLDWYPQAIDLLFGGDSDDTRDERGHFVSSADGKNLPFVHDAETEARRDRRETRKKHGITLDDCFAETGKREVLSEDNAWYCNRCKELRRANKTLEIWTIPDILVVHLKRFGGTRSFRDKLDVFVDYPIEGLDMTKRIGLKEDGKEYIYDLFAVDNHFGGLGGGHYTALAKNFYDGQWYDYNDSSCSKVTVDSTQSRTRLHSAAAYLLFYRRRSDKPLGPSELQELVIDARNPQSSAEEVGEDAESGEGRLGGPTRSLLGSSSGLPGAGVDPPTLRNGASGSLGMGLQVSNNLTTKTNPQREHATVYGPQRPPGFGQDTSWSFDNLNGDAAAETLMSKIDDGTQHDDDTASTTAMFDRDADSDSNRFDDMALLSSGPIGNTPIGSDEELPDYIEEADEPHVAAQSVDKLYLVDAGAIGEHMEQDPDTVDVYPSDPILEVEHDKMD